MIKVLPFLVLIGCASTQELDEGPGCTPCDQISYCNHIDVEIEDAEKRLGACLDKLQICDIALKKSREVKPCTQPAATKKKKK